MRRIVEKTIRRGRECHHGTKVSNLNKQTLINDENDDVIFYR